MSQCARLLTHLKNAPINPLEACKSEHMLSHATSANYRRDTNSHDLVGHVCHHLTVIEKTSFRYGNSVLWRCKCSCGRDDFLAASNKLKHGRIKSCGCKTKEILRKERTIHGMTYTPTWNSWCSMIERCYREDHKSFSDYGGRGILVCDSWRNSFEQFLADLGERPSGKTLDRIDNLKGYSPENCRWSTRKEQACNRRSSRFLVINGEKKTISQWCSIVGIGQDTASVRLKLGWSEFDAIFKPTKDQKNSRNRFGEVCRLALPVIDQNATSSLASGGLFDG